MLIHAKNAGTALPVLMSRVLNGHVVNSRVGRTRELMHTTIVLGNPRQREILHPERKALYPAQIAETMWILAGRNDVWWLSHYLPRASEFSDDGKVWRGGYGPRLRTPLLGVIELLKKDPDTRRAVINIYDSREDLGVDSKDIPCNTLLHFIRNETGCLDLVVMVRSNDLMWGWSGINAFEWSAVLEIVAHYAGMELGCLVFHQSSLHLYERSWAKAERIAGRIAEREEIPSPDEWSPEFNADGAKLSILIHEWFRIEGLIRDGSKLTSAAEITSFPEPLMRSWLWVLWSWWFGKVAEPIEGTAQETALVQSPGWTKRKSSPAPKYQELLDFMTKLHAEKDAAYVDSWCRRGELFSILPNIARKVDRLGKSDSQETALDTAVDLVLYLAKYQAEWRSDTHGEPHLRAVAANLGEVIPFGEPCSDPEEVIATIRLVFESLLSLKETKDSSPGNASVMVRSLLERAAELARYEWDKRQAEIAEMKHQLWKDGNATRKWSPEQ